MLSEEANNLFKDFCDGSKDGTVFKYYFFATGYPNLLLFIYGETPIMVNREEKIGNLESCFRELIDEGYLKLIEKSIITGQKIETYQITKRGYSYHEGTI
jgi:hypothetical protein